MTSISTILITMLLVTSQVMTFAHSQDDKITLKSRQMVENATPDDWKTLAMAASKCIQKKSNLAQASEWLDKSIAIKETAFNLTVKGDYFQLSNLADKALETYIKALKIALKENPNADVKELQTKIAEVNKSQRN